MESPTCLPSCGFESFVETLNMRYDTHGCTKAFVVATTFADAYFAFSGCLPLVSFWLYSTSLLNRKRVNIYLNLRTLLMDVVVQFVSRHQMYSLVMVKA